jgi:hypothetical protein
MKFLWTVSTTTKIYARWVLWMPTEEHKRKCMGAALMFLEHCHQEGDKFLDHIIVTGDETWGSHIVPENKCQCVVWHCFYSPLKPIKFKHVNPESPSHRFLGPERRPGGGIQAQKPNHHCCIILCNPEAATPCHQNPLVKPAVNRSGSAVQ